MRRVHARIIGARLIWSYLDGSDLSAERGRKRESARAVRTANSGLCSDSAAAVAARRRRSAGGATASQPGAGHRLFRGALHRTVTVTTDVDQSHHNRNRTVARSAAAERLG